MLAPSLAGDASSRRIDMLAALVLAGVAAVALLTFRHYGLGWDDFTHAEYGDLLLSLYASGLSDRRAFSFVNLYMYGGGFDLLAALLAKVSPLPLFETRRFVGAAVGLIGLAIAWRIGRRVGGPLVGLFALVALATCPQFYGHMFMNPKDIPFAVAASLFLLGAVRALDEFPRPTPATIAIVGIGLGLTVGTRVLGGIVALFTAVPLVFILVSETRALGARAAVARMASFGALFAPALVLAYLTMGLVWPWGVVEFLNPIKAAGYFSTFFEKPWKELYDGAFVSVPDMPRSYVPTLLALKLPELLVIAGCAGVAAAIVAAFRSDFPVPRRAGLLLLVTAAMLPVAMAVITRPAMYNGIRHFVFVLPPFAVLAGWATAVGIAYLGTQAPRLRALAAAALVVGVAVPIFEMVRLHPYQYTHFNRFAGGVRGADEKYMLDYWGLAFKQAAEELRARLTERLESPPPGRKWRVVVCGPHPAAAVELGPDFQPTWEAKGADFALMLGEFYCADVNAPVLAEVEREGVVYARAYDVRGRGITKVFTIPPP